MKIQNLKTVQEQHTAPAVVVSNASGSNSESAGLPTSALATGHADPSKQELEIALLRLRIQHLELVVETARSLLGSNQDRLLRRLYELPRELVSITSQLHRIDPHATW